MKPLAIFSPERRRTRAAWSDPERKLRTLESFARTEGDGGKDIAAAARRVSDPDLKENLERHAADERRHAELFRRRADELREGVAAARASSTALANDRRSKPRFDVHPGFEADRIERLGEVGYMAMLHVAEVRAAELFEMHQELLADDPTTRAIFTDILKDEKYHVAYTERFLERYREQGRAAEVKAGLSAARRSRLLGALERLGARSGARFGRVVLYVLYATVLAPIGLASRSGRGARGWQTCEPDARRGKASAPSARELARSQY